MPKHAYCVKSLVSTDMAYKIAEQHGVRLHDVLTGFKFIGEVIKNYETAGKLPKQREYYGLLADALHLDVEVLLDEKAEFVMKATEEYGARANAQAQEVLEKAQALFAGGEMEDEDMDAFMRSMQEAYWKAKEKNRKYVPRKYRSQEEE